MTNLDLGLISSVFSVRTDKDTIKNFQETLENNDIPYELIGNNIVHFEPTKEGYPMFVAHTDTVCKSTDEDVELIMFEAETESPCMDSVSTAVLQRKDEAILGADDRAGVFIILNEWINKGNKINFILTSDEEIGAIGASELEESTVFTEKCTSHRVSAFIEFDRKGYSDIIEYCSSDLTNEIMRILPTYKSAMGVFTDLDKIGSVVSGVNLSVGYFNAHSKSEFLDLGHLEYLVGKISDIEEGLKDKVFDKYVPYSKYYDWYSSYSKDYQYNWWDYPVEDDDGNIIFNDTQRKSKKYKKRTKYKENDYCLYCGNTHVRVYFLSHVEYGICLGCLEDLQNELDDVIDDITA